jgi:HSP20 family protein
MITRMLYGADPLRNMRRLEDEMNRLQERATARAPEFPAVNVFANQDGVILSAELPEVRTEDLAISIHRDSVTLSGDRRTETEEARGYHRRERRHGRFVRTLSLPFMVDPKKAEAGLVNGVLTLQLPRAEEDKPRRIVVKTSEGTGRG